MKIKRPTSQEILKRLTEYAWPLITKNYPQFKLNGKLSPGKLSFRESYFISEEDRKNGSPEFTVTDKRAISVPSLDQHFLAWASNSPIQMNPVTVLAAVTENTQKRLSRVVDVVAILGPAFSGKSTVARKLAAEVDGAGKTAKVIPMAERLKELARSMGWDGKKDDRGRKLLQNMGTEVGRAYNPFMWANAWTMRMIGKNETACIICDDVRYEEELWMMILSSYIMGAKFHAVRLDVPKHILKQRRDNLGAADPCDHSSEKYAEVLLHLTQKGFPGVDLNSLVIPNSDNPGVAVAEIRRNMQVFLK